MKKKAKKMISLLLCIAALLCLPGCGEEVNEAEKTAGTYFQAMMEGDYETWCLIAGGNLSQELFEMMNRMWAGENISQYTFEYRELKGSNKKSAVESHQSFTPSWFMLYGGTPNYSLSDIQKAGVITVSVREGNKTTPVYVEAFVLTDQGWRLGQFDPNDYIG